MNLEIKSRKDVILELRDSEGVLFFHSSLESPAKISNLGRSGDMKMGKCSRKDFISDMPQGIIDSILVKLPIRDAVRTSILSTKWRYQWAVMTKLVFVDHRMCLPNNREITEKELGNFITRFLFLHHGPVHKFRLESSCLKNSSDIDQWLLFLSRKDIKELVLRLWCIGQRLQLPSCIFSCRKLTKLELYGFNAKPPLGFQGFPCLKYLYLAGPFTLEVIENLISGCPLLKRFILTSVSNLALTVRAPNLKHLTLNGFFKDVYLEHTPLLVSISINLLSRAWEGNLLTKVPLTYDCLKFIVLQSINYSDMNRVLYVLNLILQSPNLQELQIEATPLKYSQYKAADLDIWEKECPTDFTFKHLKLLKMSRVSNDNCVKFLKFVLGRSPVLEVMSVSPYVDYIEKMNMANEVLHFRRASSKVDIKFFD